MVWYLNQYFCQVIFPSQFLFFFHWSTIDKWLRIPIKWWITLLDRIWIWKKQQDDGIKMGWNSFWRKMINSRSDQFYTPVFSWYFCLDPFLLFWWTLGQIPCQSNSLTGAQRERILVQPLLNPRFLNMLGQVAPKKVLSRLKSRNLNQE